MLIKKRIKMNNNLVKYLSISLMIIIGISIFLGYSLYKTKEELKQANSVYEQNELSKKEIQRLKQDSIVWVQKYIEVTNLNKNKDKLLKQNNETIIFQDSKIIKLESIIESMSGLIVDTNNNKDTNKIPEFLIGKKLLFESKKDFYNIKSEVKLDNPPINKTELTFFDKIKLTSFISRNKEGKFSGYAKFSPSFINNYLSISEMDIEMEKDEFAGLLKPPIAYQFFLDAGIIAKENTTLSFGATLIHNEKWKLGYQKSISENLHLLNIGYGVFSIK